MNHRVKYTLTLAAKIIVSLALWSISLMISTTGEISGFNFFMEVLFAVAGTVHWILWPDVKNDKLPIATPIGKVNVKITVSDKEHLRWMYNRLELLYNEDIHSDYMIRLDQIIKSIPNVESVDVSIENSHE